MKSQSKPLMPKIVNNTNFRDHYIDVLKGGLIILVVWGHFIQYSHGIEYDYWENPIFKIIYGFHMPLFGGVSGYLYFYSLKRNNSLSILIKKIKQLLLPCVTWSVLLTCLDVIINIITKEKNDAIFIVFRVFTRFINDLWFLKCIFLACFLVYFIEKTKAKVLFYIFVVVFTNFLPSIYNLNLYGFIFPFFVLGYKVAQYDIKKKFKSITIRTRIILFIISAIIYFVLVYLYKKDLYIYVSGIDVINSKYGVCGQLGINAFRYIVALCGISFFLSFNSCLFSFFEKNTKITVLSNETMSIYVITASIFSYLPQAFRIIGFRELFVGSWFWIADLFLLFPISLLVTYITVRIRLLIQGKLLSKLLFGK